MRVPLSWLRDYVDLDLSPEELADRLTMLGLEVKGLERIGEGWRNVVVGELLEVVRHPHADRLSLTRVRVGGSEPELSIVCGATNIAAGQHVPVALPGSILPGGREIGVSRIAGVESQGMLCSGIELGLTRDAEGILILDESTAVGTPLERLTADTVLDLDVKPNRGDVLSLIGLAREVAAITGGRPRWPAAVALSGGPSGGDQPVEVEIREPVLCPRFVARRVAGIRVGPSPARVQLRLEAAGVRSISNVVDASNYAMLELGKPTHAFDADRIAPGGLVVRLAQQGEQLEALDHVVRELDTETLLIADATGPVAIAGVLGGAASEVSAETSAVIVESAIFDPVSIRRTARRHGLRSEASLRFEKGQEWRLARVGADRVAELIVDWGGGHIDPGVTDTAPSDPDPRLIAFRPARIRRLLGADIAGPEMRELLERVEIATEPASAGDQVPLTPEITAPIGEGEEAYLAIVPPHRADLAIEADIAEEVARIRGYETLGPTLPSTRMPAHRPDPQRSVDELRHLLAGQGLAEVVSHALVGPTDHERIGIDPADPATILAENPIASDHDRLRRSLIPELTRVLAENERRRRPDVALFEIGAEHRWSDGAPSERRVLTIMLSGEWRPAAWDRPAAAADALDLRGLVAWLCRRVGIDRVRFTHAEASWPHEHPGRTAVAQTMTPAGEWLDLGRVGELHPTYLATIEVRSERVAFATLDLDFLGLLRAPARRLSPPPRVPPVDRDLAVIRPGDAPAGEVEDLIRETGGPILEDVRLFDWYAGPPLADGEVSLAYRLRLQDPERTLTDVEVDGVLRRIIDALESRLGARIRS